jgi:hypothetical protein
VLAVHAQALLECYRRQASIAGLPGGHTVRVSGGSLAGAYLAAYRPAREEATAAELSALFARFKDAMATDFEREIAVDFLRPSRTLGFLFGFRSGAESLAEGVHRRLFGGSHLRFGPLLVRERMGGPLLIVNATHLADFGLLAFTPDTVGADPCIRSPSGLGLPA